MHLHRLLLGLAALSALATAAAPAATAKAPSLRTAKSVSVAEGASARFTVTLSAKPRRPGSVRFRTVAGSAGTADFRPRARVKLVFKKGRRSARVSVRTLEDVADEPAETFKVRFSRARGLRIARRTTTVTIVDDDAPPAPSPAVPAPFPAAFIRDVSVSEQPGGFVQVPVTLSAPSSRATSVAYSTANGTAVAGDSGDYLSASGTVVIPAGAGGATIPVFVRNDATDEDEQTFSVRLSAPSGLHVADGEAVVAIGDDDPPPAMSVNDVTRTEGNTIATFTVTLNIPSEKAVTAKVSTVAGTATGAAQCGGTADYLSLTNLPVFIAPGQASSSFDVGVCGDATPEPTETANVVLAEPTNAVPLDATGLLTIIDND